MSYTMKKGGGIFRERNIPGGGICPRVKCPYPCWTAVASTCSEATRRDNWRHNARDSQACDDDADVTRAAAEAAAPRD